VQVISKNFKRDLNRLVRQPSLGLGVLIDHWERIERSVAAERQRLLRAIKAHDDPIRFPVDLLSPIGRSTDENTHTRLLVYLLNPNDESHGFSKSTLIAVIGRLPRCQSKSAVLQLVRRARANITVYPQYFLEVDKSSVRSTARCDIWIEIRAGKSRALVVIENKIDAPDGKDQHHDYAIEARKRAQKLNAKLLLVRLNRKERAPAKGDEDWTTLSYVGLASALRSVWRTQQAAPGRTLLGLYIASITKGVLGVDVNRIHHTPISVLEAYLREGP
jgi:hypothetical protein